MTTRTAADGSSQQLTPNELKQGADATQWYYDKIEIPEQAQKLLEQYARLKAEEVIPHVTDLVGIHPELNNILKGLVNRFTEKTSF